MISRGLAGVLRDEGRSVLLLGPRQVGKSTLMTSLGPQVSINLARESTFLEFAAHPQLLEERLAARTEKRLTVYVDEVQRLPSILNTVQAVLDESPGRFQFLLTGSSARKLRRGGANLLPGRIHTYSLGAVTAKEMGYRFPLRQGLSTGALPGILSESRDVARRKTLRSYASTYLREEVQAEALTRSIEGFSRFVSVIGPWSGRTLDVHKLSLAAQVPRTSVTRWLEVLEDTLMVRRLDAFAKSATRRLIQHPKLYFFDVGVLNGLLGNFEASLDRVGDLFEHLVCQQLFDSAAALDVPIRVSTFRTEAGAEVDFIVEFEGKVWAIEVKASTNVGPGDLTGLRRFSDYFGKSHQARLWFFGAEPRRIAGVDVLPWQQGLEEMGF